MPSGHITSLLRAWTKGDPDARDRLASLVYDDIADAESRCWHTVIRAETGPGGLIVPMQVREFVESEELRNARQALADLEEELRRAGLPPGWAR